MKIWRYIMLRTFPRTWFQCAKCGGIWKKGKSDEECTEEYKENFPNDLEMKYPIDVICEDCYKPFRIQLDNLTPKEKRKIEKEFGDHENE